MSEYLQLAVNVVSCRSEEKLIALDYFFVRFQVTMVEISSCQVLSRFTHEFDGPLTCTRLFRCSLIFSSTCPINAHFLLKLLFLWCIFFIIMMNLRVEGEPEEAPACLSFPRVTKPDTSELAPLHLCVTYSLGSSKVKLFFLTIVFGFL